MLSVDKTSVATPTCSRGSLYYIFDEEYVEIILIILSKLPTSPTWPCIQYGEQFCVWCCNDLGFVCCLLDLAPFFILVSHQTDYKIKQ